MSTDVKSTGEALRKIVDQYKPSFVLCCGTSMGGYASILYGTMIGADHVLALAPQTLLQDGVKSNGDTLIYRVYACIEQRPYDEPYMDLLSLTYSKTVVEIVFSMDDEADAFHAIRFQDMPNVEYAFSSGTHGEVAKNWRDSGKLSKKLRSFL